MPAARHVGPLIDSKRNDGRAFEGRRVTPRWSGGGGNLCRGEHSDRRRVLTETVWNLSVSGHSRCELERIWRSVFDDDEFEVRECLSLNGFDGFVTESSRPVRRHRDAEQ
jgi:hypothetical protein